MNTPCELWTKATNTKGYGLMKIPDGPFILAHRAAYLAAGGDIPEGYQLDHLCSVKRCRNTSHLEPVTPKENIHRMYRRPTERPLRTHCKRGHLYDSITTTKRGIRQAVCLTCKRARGAA